MEFIQCEKGYIAHPIPTAIKIKTNSDHTIYFTRSTGRRRLRKPKATEITRAKRSIDCKWLSLNPISTFTLCALAPLHTHAPPPVDLPRPLRPQTPFPNPPPHPTRPPPPL